MDDEQRAKNNAKQKRYYEKKRNDPNFKEKERLRQRKLRDAKAATMTKKEKKEIIKFHAKKPKLIIWSDGPSSEFKNKFVCYVLFMLSKIQKRFSSFEWKYSATGKGVVDGIGGTSKSRVYAEVKARRATECSQFCYSCYESSTKCNYHFYVTE